MVQCLVFDMISLIGRSVVECYRSLELICLLDNRANRRDLLRVLLRLFQ